MTKQVKVSMFKQNNTSEINPLHFGVGSVITGPASDEKYMLICTGGGNVILLDMNTFKLHGDSTRVNDINYLTEEECRNVVSQLPYAFSDYSYNTKGFK